MSWTFLKFQSKGSTWRKKPLKAQRLCMSVCIILPYVCLWKVAHRSEQSDSVTKAASEDRQRTKWQRKRGSQSPDSPTRRGERFRTNRHEWCHVFGTFISVKHSLSYHPRFARIWFVGVSVCVCECHSQGKDLLPLHLFSSSIIYTVRNHRRPEWPCVSDTAGNAWRKTKWRRAGCLVHSILCINVYSVCVCVCLCVFKCL